MRGNKIESMIWVMFFCLGLIFFVIGILICINLFNYKDKVETVGTITKINSYTDSDGEQGHSINVEYTVDDQKYESSLNFYSSNFYEGKKINIYYDANNPSKIGSKTMDYIFLIFPGIGLIFAVIGGTGLCVKIKKTLLNKNLKEYGQKVYAKIIDIEYNKRYSVNGRHPYNIICQWDNEMDGKKYIFRSENIWFNPTEAISQRNIDTLPVYIDITNKKKYVIDTDILKNEVMDLT